MQTRILALFTVVALLSVPHDADASRWPKQLTGFECDSAGVCNNYKSWTLGRAGNVVDEGGNVGTWVLTVDVYGQQIVTMTIAGTVYEGFRDNTCLDGTYTGPAGTGNWSGCR